MKLCGRPHGLYPDFRCLLPPGHIEPHCARTTWWESSTIRWKVEPPEEPEDLHLTSWVCMPQGDPDA